MWKNIYNKNIQVGTYEDFHVNNLNSTFERYRYITQEYQCKIFLHHHLSTFWIFISQESNHV